MDKNSLKSVFEDLNNALMPEVRFFRDREMFLEAAHDVKDELIKSALKTLYALQAEMEKE